MYEAIENVGMYPTLELVDEEANYYSLTRAHMLSPPVLLDTCAQTREWVLPHLEGVEQASLVRLE
jgi:hypothetical protein